MKKLFIPLFIMLGVSLSNGTESLWANNPQASLTFFSQPMLQTGYHSALNSSLQVPVQNQLRFLVRSHPVSERNHNNSRLTIRNEALKQNPFPVISSLSAEIYNFFNE